MPEVIQFPGVVVESLTEFVDLFANPPQGLHFAEHLIGLFGWTYTAASRATTTTRLCRP